MLAPSLAGGINNEYASAFLAVVGDADPPSVSPQSPGSPYVCNDCPNRAPARYFLLPRTEVNQAIGDPYNVVAKIHVVDSGLEVSTREVQTPSLLSRAIYRLSPRFEVESVEMSDTYWETHRRLEQQGRLTHTVEECPEMRTGLEVRSWVGGAWQRVLARQAMPLPPARTR